MDTKRIKLLPNRLQELRKIKGLSQTQVAQAIGVSIALYHRIENGERTIQDDYIDKLAKVLEIESEEIKSLVLADKIEDETNKYSQGIVDNAFKALNNK